MADLEAIRCHRVRRENRWRQAPLAAKFKTMTDSTSRIRVLVAEDDDNARGLLIELLSTLGHTVVAEVSTGREAFERAKDVVPDVVLLDVHMPDGSGIEAAERITQTVPGVAVVLFSGDHSLTLSDRDVTATAAIAFLPKPAPPRVLDSTIPLAATRAKELMAARQDAESARQALENRKTIERAKGILMRRTGSSEQEAYRILQRTSQDRSVPMVEIARAVLASEPGFQEAAKDAGRAEAAPVARRKRQARQRTPASIAGRFSFVPVTASCSFAPHDRELYERRDRQS